MSRRSRKGRSMMSSRRSRRSRRSRTNRSRTSGGAGGGAARTEHGHHHRVQVPACPRGGVSAVEPPGNGAVFVKLRVLLKRWHSLSGTIETPAERRGGGGADVQRVQAEDELRVVAHDRLGCRGQRTYAPALEPALLKTDAFACAAARTHRSPRRSRRLQPTTARCCGATADTHARHERSCCYGRVLRIDLVGAHGKCHQERERDTCQRYLLGLGGGGPGLHVLRVGVPVVDAEAEGRDVRDLAGINHNPR